MAASWPVPVVRAAVPKDCDARHRGRNLLEQFQPFRAHAVFELDKTGRVTARPRHAFDQATADRVNDIHKHDWHDFSCLLQRPRVRSAGGYDDLRLEIDQFRRISTNAVGIAGAPPVVNLQIAADGPAHFLQPLRKRREAGRCTWIVRSERAEHADPPRPLRLLPLCGERP
jgi:hypothetical protein